MFGGLIKYDFEMVNAKIFSILDETALKEGEKKPSNRHPYSFKKLQILKIVISKYIMCVFGSKLKKKKKLILLFNLFLVLFIVSLHFLVLFIGLIILF